MRRTTLSLLLLAQAAADEPLSPAQEAAKKAAGERMESVVKPGDTANAAVRTISVITNPVAVGSQILTGVLTYQLKKAIATSTWSMNMTQKYAAKSISGFLSKQEKEPFEVTNSKVEGLVILTFTAKGLNQEKAERLANQEPMWKYQKTGWDRVVFSNGEDAWAWDTSIEIGAPKP